MNDVVKFNTSDVSLDGIELIFHNNDMKEMLIKRILTFATDFDMNEYEFVEKFMTVFESISYSKDYKRALKAAKKE